MKKLVIGAMSLILLLSLSACQDNSLVLETQDKIIAIGEVTLESETAIISAETAYNELEDAQKKKVENYADLTSARTAYTELQKAEEERLAAELAEQERLAPIQEFAAKVLTKNAIMFKNPLSINVKNAWYYHGGMLDQHYVTFEFEIENGIGNVQTVFYGNDTFGYRELLESEIDSEINLYSGLGISTSFEENGIVAMQEGELLDAEYIQEYFRSNYGK